MDFERMLCIIRLLLKLHVYIRLMYENDSFLLGKEYDAFTVAFDKSMVLSNIYDF